MPDLTLNDITSPGPVAAGDPESLERKELEYLKGEAELERFRQTTEQRRFYALLIYGLVVGWVVLVFLVLFSQGFAWFTRPLADAVLMWLVGGSTGSILGILYLVISHLFPKDGG